MMEKISSEFERTLRTRLADLVDKESWMRNSKNPDGPSAPILIGRVQGQIGEVKYILEIAGCKV
jgi:hypothetical protein